MSRLKEKLSKAAGVLGRITAKAEARADSVIERETVIEKRIDEVFAPHEEMLGDTEKGLDDVERQLALVSNGGEQKKEVASTTSSTETADGSIQSAPQPQGLTRGLNKG